MASVRAIVKDLIAHEKGYVCREFKACQVLQMYEDLKTLHSLGMLVGDVHMGNYMNEKLINFSRAFTMYHQVSTGRCNISWRVAGSRRV